MRTLSTTRRLRACLALGVCLGTAPAATAQTPPVFLQGSGGNITLPTPQQQAQVQKWFRLWRAGVVALHTGDYIQAEDDARQSLALGGTGFAEPLLAGALAEQDREQEALQEYRVIVVEQGSAYPRDLLPYALLLLKAGDWARAVAAYNKALPLLADGDLMRAQDRFSPAVPQPKALAVALHIALGLTKNGACDWVGESQDDQALAEYGEALHLAPDSDLTNYYYGYGLQKLGRTAQASVAFQKTVKMAKGGVKTAAEQALKKLNKPT